VPRASTFKISSGTNKAVHLYPIEAETTSAGDLQPQALDDRPIELLQHADLVRPGRGHHWVVGGPVTLAVVDAGDSINRCSYHLGGVLPASSERHCPGGRTISAWQ
jgi:hypothetical protein